MNEVQENQVRNFLAKMRRENPRVFRTLVFDALLAGQQEESFSVIGRSASPPSPPHLLDGLLVIFKGVDAATKAAQCILDMRKRGELPFGMEEDDSNAEDEDSGEEF